MSYNGRRLGINFREHSQIALLLQTVLHHRKEGMGKDLLVQTLFGGQELKDVSHSLRNVLYLTQKKLRELGLPDLEYFQKEKNTYYWTSEIEVAEDAEEFETAFYLAAKGPDSEKKFELMMKAARLYTGSFLRGEENVPWVLREKERLSGLFGRCMWEIGQLAPQLNRYPELYDAGRHAAEADSFSNWEALELKALVGLDRYEEAEDFYNRTVKKYAEKFGSMSAKKVRDLEREMGNYLMFRQEDISGIQERLKRPEDTTRGGFYCPFPIFQEHYRSVERIMARFGGYIFLMLCTLADKDGIPLKDGTVLKEEQVQKTEIPLKESVILRDGTTQKDMAPQEKGTHSDKEASREAMAPQKIEMHSDEEASPEEMALQKMEMHSNERVSSEEMTPSIRDISRGLSNLAESGKEVRRGITEYEQVSELLLESIVHSVRHSDTITRYSKGQYLVLLLGTNEENCSVITDRIDAGFAKMLKEYQEAGTTDVEPAIYTVAYSISKVIADGRGSFPFFENVGRKPGFASPRTEMDV